MNPNNSQPQDDRDRNGVPIPVVGPAPQYQAAAPIQQPQQQPQIPPPVPGWFAAEPLPDDEPPHKDRTPIPFGRILKVLTFIILIGGIVGGVGYGLVSIFNQAETEQDRLASAQEAFNEEVKKYVYTGDGSDIERTAKAAISYGCPAGYDKDKTGKKCISLEKTIATIKSYKCKSGYEKTGTDQNPECSKIKGGTKEKKPAAKNVKCPDGFSESGSKCQKTEKSAADKVYSCPSGYNKTGTGSDTTCSKSVPVTGAVVADCPGGFVTLGSGASANCLWSRTGTQVKAYDEPACQSGYSRIGDICSGNALPVARSKINCPPSFPQVGSSCVQVVNTSVSYSGWFCSSSLVSQGYTLISGSCQKKIYSAYISYSNGGKCPSGYTKAARALGGTPPCSKVLYATASRNTYYNCPSATSSWYPTKLNNSYCRLTLRTTPIQYWTDFTCPNGTNPIGGIQKHDDGTITVLSGKCSYATTKFHYYTSCSGIGGEPSGANCVRRQAPSLSCKGGLEKVGTGTGTICTKNNIGTASPTGKTTCNKGSADGDQCVRTEVVSPTVTYNCESGYKREGTQCTRIVGGTKVTSTPTPLIACKDGYKLVGKGDKAKCEQQKNVETKLQKIYTCQDGWKQRITPKKVDCVLVRA